MAKDTWYKVDNVAKVFLASANKRDTRCCRMTCTLNEDIDEHILNEALELAAAERPQYQVTIQRGFFWHYMESTDSKPVAVPENDRPCPDLYTYKNFGKLHYLVSYYNNRINLDFFHAIADGNGAIEYLNLIVMHYLKLKHPEELHDFCFNTGTSDEELSQDSFEHFYEKKSSDKRNHPNRKAYHIMGSKLPNHQLKFMEVHMKASDVLAKSHEMDVSLSAYLGAKLMKAVYDTMPALLRNKPITISMPVNLRNYYPSQTSRNFFNSVFISKVLKPEETLSDIASYYSKSLKECLTPEAVRERMNNYEKMERFFLVRMVPLFIKNPVVNIVTKQNNKKVTAVLSNLGKLTVPEEVNEYINSYAAYCSTNSLFVVVSTYKDDLVLGISSAFRNTQVLKNFITGISDEGIDVTLYANEIVE